MASVVQLYVIDHGHLDEHTLNRTPLKPSQIEQMKEPALAASGAERGTVTVINPVTKQLEDVAGQFSNK